MGEEELQAAADAYKTMARKPSDDIRQVSAHRLESPASFRSVPVLPVSYTEPLQRTLRVNLCIASMRKRDSGVDVVVSLPRVRAVFQSGSGQRIVPSSSRLTVAVGTDASAGFQRQSLRHCCRLSRNEVGTRLVVCDRHHPLHLTHLEALLASVLFNKVGAFRLLRAASSAQIRLPLPAGVRVEPAWRGQGDVSTPVRAARAPHAHAPRAGPLRARQENHRRWAARGERERFYCHIVSGQGS